MSGDELFHMCNWCGEKIDISDAGGNPREVAVLLLAHIKLGCSAVPGPVDLSDLNAADIPSTDVPVTDEPTADDFFARWDLVSMGGVMLQTHHERLCKPPCVIHSPSEHHMRTWEQVWSQAHGAVLRRCPHSHYHPDPDDLCARTATLLHTCDGCCLPPR